MDRPIAVLTVVIILLMGSLTISFFIEDVEASSLNIIDYAYEGIYADTTQYFVIWVHGNQSVTLTVSATILEFVGSTGWPQLEMKVFEFQDYNYTDDYIAICRSENNYTCRLDFQSENNSRYTLAVSNLDPVDDAVYNLTISAIDDIDFQYTSIYELDDITNPQDNTISITYFENSNPFLYRLESLGNSRVVVEYIPYSYDEEEMYFFIINKGQTCELFVGLLGIPYYTDYPELTAFIIDFEDYGQEDQGVLYLWTISNFTTGGTFTCESGHRYNFWIDLGYYQPDVFVMFDSFGTEDINFDTDLFATNPDGEVSIRYSITDPWLEFQQLNRNVMNFYLGIGGVTVTGAIGAIVCLRRRYN